MADIAEQICLAVDQIVNKRLESINFDTTITATIIDNKNAKNNQYICSNGEAEFVAYSKDQNYKIGESVQVTIPNNDYSQQKVIIGRHVVKDEKPFTFTQPFDTIIDVSGNIITNNEEPIVKSLLANEDYDINPIDEKTKKYSIKNQEILLWDVIFEEGYANFTRLGLQGQFRSWLASLKPITGSYGYKLEVFSDNGAIINNQLVKDWLKIYRNILNEVSYSEDDLSDLLEKTPDIWFENINNLSKFEAKITKEIFIETMKITADRKDLIHTLIYANVQVSEILLDSSEMYGNPYNFQSYLEQEKVYDISSLGKIFGCMLYFYEASGTFFNEKEEYIPYKTANGQYFNPNLFTKDPYICFGYDLSGFTEEQAIIYTLDSDTYIIDDKIDKELNKKAIRLRWLHEFENGDIKVINENSNISGYDIRWYRFKLGAPSSDEYSGVYWNRVNQSYTVEENIPLDNINNLKTYYLLFHYLDDGTVANEYNYLENFCPKYTNYATVGPMPTNSFSHMSYWTDECLAKYNIDKSLAQHAFAGYTTSSITKFADQKWIDIFNQGFVYHNTNYQGSYYRDYYTGLLFPVPSGCMHKIGFWEKLTLAYRLYWIYPEEFALLLEDNDIWKQGGVASTGKFNKYGDWINFRGKNPYTEMSYQGNDLYSDFESGTSHFTERNQTTAFRNLFALFADSFGEWTYIEDEYGMRDYVPADEGTRNYLYQCVEKFFIKMDDPTYLKVITFDPFSYVLEPAVNTQSEQIKAIVLYNGKVIRSNILTFTNEVEVASAATAELMSGLSIWCADNSYGNYYIYGQNNNLLNDSKTNEILTLEAHFADSALLAQEYDIDVVSKKLQEAKEITWEFPLNNTMIIVHGFNYSYAFQDDEVFADNTLNYSLIQERDKENNGARYKLPGYLQNENVQVRGNSIFITRVCDNNGAINPLQTYRIARTYSASKINNTIKCSIKKNSLLYSATKDLSFGLMGTNGTDATVVIDFNNNKTALTANLDSETLKVTAHLYDANHREVDFNDLGLGLSCEWEWEYYQVESGQEIELTQRLIKNADGDWVLNDDTIPINVCYLSHNTALSIENKNFFLILKVTIKGWGDYELISFKAIPIRANSQYRNIVGPTEVIYSSSGYADYYKEAYELWWCADPTKVNAEYDIVSDDTTLTRIATDWDSYNPLGESINFIGIVENNILKPASIYTKNAKPYGAICYLNTENSKSDPIWIQPLVILQNEYPSATINKWDGKSVELNSDEGFIISPAIAAGKKDSENRFSGVMIGDWSKTNTATDIAKMTGVYGFHEGAVSFAFKEDGTAFIGKSGRGRIYFEGNSGVLKSASWDSVDNRETGMYLDLDDGILKLQKEPGFDQIQVTAETYSPNTYYILSTTYHQVPLNTPYGENFVPVGGTETFYCSTDTVYYKKAMVAVARMTKAIFDKKVSQGLLYTRNAATYTQCTSKEDYKENTIFYIYTYTETTVDEATYNANKSKYFITSDGGKTYTQATGNWNSATKYYIRSLGTTIPLQSDFESNPTLYYIRNEYTYTKVATSAVYSDTITYYEYGYEAQNYGLMGIPNNWNTLEDLGANNYYYTSSEAYKLCTDANFDVTQIYYEDNRTLSARYITLSAAADRFPLAIGNHSSEYARKFRVDWDGTCYIEDGVFSGDINANTGYLGDLILRGGLTLNTSGYIAANKSDLNDFVTNGFWLDRNGLNIGGSTNYFYASTAFTAFYNTQGGTKITGSGIDIFAGLTPSSAYETFSGTSEGTIHIGWNRNESVSQWSYPYIRFGNGTDEGTHTAGIVKKFGGGMWIGNMGLNTVGNNPSDDVKAEVGMFLANNFIDGSGGESQGKVQKWVYRCEIIDGQRHFEPARWARFA